MQPAATSEAGKRLRDSETGQGHVQAAFWHKQTRRRDDVNHLAMLKPAYDGLVEAGLLVDDDPGRTTTRSGT